MGICAATEEPVQKAQSRRTECTKRQGNRRAKHLPDPPESLLFLEKRVFVTGGPRPHSGERGESLQSGGANRSSPVGRIAPVRPPRARQIAPGECGFGSLCCAFGRPRLSGRRSKAHSQRAAGSLHQPPRPAKRNGSSSMDGIRLRHPERRLPRSADASVMRGQRQPAGAGRGHDESIGRILVKGRRQAIHLRDDGGRDGDQLDRGR
jgi:hypothetical protein